ncbi:HAD family hydrolase [Melioribacter sp. OK-6-Me]|uniref:HAD family hydrolase n=1 Tax=unclassified Melioribacter TaxID=2627329 RepID=UPI003EDB21BE
MHPDPKAKALLFDCDGTLVDSMPLHLKAWEYAINLFGYEFDYNFFFSKRGMPSEEIIKLYNNYFGTDIDPEKIVNVKNEFFKRYADSIKPIAPVASIVYEYYNKLPMAVVSGGSKENVMQSLAVTGLDKYFDLIVTADDNLKHKPAPDMFLYAAEKLKTEPEYCVVYEDGDFGVEAAKKAGMMIVDIRDFIEVE